MNNYTDIIERLEKADQPNIELDCFIAASVGWLGLEKDGDIIAWKDENGHFQRNIPFFTRSIDAALTLVPDGLNYVLRSLQGHAEARVGGRKSTYMIKGGHHPVPAISLCIAALKARAAMAGEGGEPERG